MTTPRAGPGTVSWVTIVPAWTITEVTSRNGSVRGLEAGDEQRRVGGDGGDDLVGDLEPSRRLPVGAMREPFGVGDVPLPADRIEQHRGTWSRRPQPLRQQDRRL